KRRRKPTHCPPRTEIRDKANEIRPVRIKESEQRRIVLAARRAAIPADRLDRGHESNVVSAPPRGLGIHHASLLVRREEWRLFVDEGNEAHGQCWIGAGKEARQLEKRRDAARIIVGARTAGDRIVMRSDQKNFTLARAAAARDFEV